MVIGSLQEFSTDKGVNEDRYRSFELFRQNTNSPEIFTFDELYERAKFIVQQRNLERLQELLRPFFADILKASTVFVSFSTFPGRKDVPGALKQVLNGLATIVHGLATMRNKMPNAHL